MTHATVFVCGDRHRRDDGAALLAADRLGEVLPKDVILCRVGQLGPDDLVAASAAGRCLVLDTVRGISPGRVISRRLLDLETGGLHSASSHALPLPTVIALASALGADMTDATFMGIGGEDFELGEGLTPSVEAGIDGFVATVTGTLMCEGPDRCA